MYPFPARCPEPRISASRFEPEPRQQTLFDDVCSLVQPSTILEVGSWMGSSAIAWARSSLKHKPDAVIYCVDTWLGSVEHYLSTCGDDWNISKLSLGDYGPTFFDDFLRNVWDSGCQDRIIPFRADSSSALPFLFKEGLKFDVIYVDGAHDHHSVFRDVTEALRITTTKGIVCGDDFTWSSVRSGLYQAAICHESSLRFYTKKNDFVILNNADPSYSRRLMQWGYVPWGPSQLRKGAHRFAADLKGAALNRLSNSR